MKTIILTTAMLAASLVLISCGVPAANNAANSGNKPANAANTATTPAGIKPRRKPM